MARESNGHRRVAIVRGLRTPFVKAGSVFSGLTALDLGRMVVQELVQRSDIDPERDQPARLRAGHPHADGPVHRARGGHRRRAAPEDRGLHRGARLCHLHPGHDDGGQRHRRGRGGRRHRGRHRVHVGRAHLHQPPPGACAGGGLQGQELSGQAQALPEAQGQGSAAGAPGHRRVLHRHDAWARAPRRWPRRTASPARSRTASPWPRTTTPHAPGRRAGSTTR